MIQDNLKLDLDNSKLNTNLLLYRLVKELVQAKISDKNIIIIIEEINLINKKLEFSKKKEILINKVLELKFTKIKEIISDHILEENHLFILRLALNILRFKNFILEKSKLHSENFKVKDNIHIMDFEYDQGLLNIPYSSRVAGALLIKSLFNEIKSDKTDFYKSINYDIDKVKDIEAEVILQIIFAESISQSIKSTSGSSYEERFKRLLKANNIKFETQSFDSNIKSVEYDFKILLDDKVIGVSAKRTVRERYKQNHENVDFLDVDAVILVTLGIDLTAEKVENITKKKGNYIFVASDIYCKIDFFINNNKVYPLSQLNTQILLKLLETQNTYT